MTAPRNRFNPGDSVSAQEANALDQWLDATATTPRRAADLVSARPDNGAITPAPSLQAIAQHAHSMIAAAETNSGPDVPVDAIWEKIMASTTPHAPTSPATPLRHFERSREISRRSDQHRTRHIPAILSGSHWVFSALMLAAVVVGIIAIYGSFADSNRITDYDPATNPGFAASSPDATPDGSSNEADFLQPISAEECNVEPRPLDEVAALMQDPGETIPREYGPVQPVSEDQALWISNANRRFQSCHTSGEIGDWRAMVSPRLIYEGQGGAFPNPYAGLTAQEYIAENRELSDALLSGDNGDYTIVSDKEAPLSEDGTYDLQDDFSLPILLPEDVVQFPDGRMGGPSTRLQPANLEEIQQSYNTGQATPAPLDSTVVDFYFFAQDPTQDERWVVDEKLTLCASGCDAWYAQLETYYDEAARPGPTIADSMPPATPQSATPDAAWLQPLSAGECNVEPRSLDQVAAFLEDPGPSAPRQYLPVTPATEAQAEAAANTSRAISACYAMGEPGQWRAFASPRFINNRDGSLQVTSFPDMTYEEYIAWNRELSAALLPGGAGSSVTYADFEMTPEANDEHPGDRPGFQMVLPDQVLQLPDGRIGGPSTYVVPSNVADFNPYYQDNLEATQEASPYVLTLFDVFAQDATQNDRWVLDERLVLCTGNCDDYYEGIRPSTLDGIPTPAAAPVATPQAWIPVRTW